jgi:hypothetical protein
MRSRGTSGLSRPKPTRLTYRRTEQPNFRSGNTDGQKYAPLNRIPNRGDCTPERMSKGELYEYYKRIGMLEVYFALFPGG